ncbi:class I SAM-dependent DNA methyltransferase [Nitrosophilus alvini]|uniref:class I SAM-dependent DNA methyltransferase n=1 Tax=Nitrosophilus alvini TaxID=2714855 RepID=UPI00190BF374|nr:class I SAM-dependent methyltransferase [Nitrosophilus alvini]
MGLDLYAKIEPYLGFDEEIEYLHRLFLEKLKKSGAKKILDIGCGSGSFLQKAKAAGLEAKGIDLSGEMVRRARQSGVDAECKDLCDVNEKFDAAVAIFDVLNYLDKKELAKFLKCAKKVLKEGGKLYCDINTAYGFGDIAQGVMVIDKDDIFIAVDAVFENEILNTDITVFEKENGCFKKNRSSIVQYYHSIEDIKRVSPMRLVSYEEIFLFSDDTADKRVLIFENSEKEG